jgi:hypothetical protein
MWGGQILAAAALSGGSVPVKHPLRFVQYEQPAPQNGIIKL